MLQLLANYALFLAKVATLVIAFLVILGAIVSSVRKEKPRGYLEVIYLNDDYDEPESTVEEVVLSKAELKQRKKDRKKKEKLERKTEKQRVKAGEEAKPRVFLVRFDGDLHASEVENLRECVTALLMIAGNEDEVVVVLNSPGGLVHSYGLAASQLARLKEKEIALTVCIDEVAASGGYMMACVADKIIAAPFSVVGSIGVVGQLPNFNRLMHKHHIDYELHTAGEYKRTLTVLGENTRAAREKFKEELEEAHTLFKEHINGFRPEVDLDKVATGEHWYGTQALDLNLIDELQTSDDYLLDKRTDHDLYEVTYVEKQSLEEKLSHLMGRIYSKIQDSFLSRLLSRNHY
jgi:serine protease SohB